MCQRIRFPNFVLIISLLLLCSPDLLAADVTLVWNPNPEADLAGYRIYRGRASGIYDSVTTVGKQTAYTFADLLPGAYYFAITAFNEANLESGFSNEVWTVIPSTVIAEIPSPFKWDTGSYNWMNPAEYVKFGILPADNEVNLTAIASGAVFLYPLNPAEPAAANPGEREFLGLALTNLGVQPGIVLFTGYDDAGVVLTGDGIVNPLARLLAPGEQVQVLENDLFGAAELPAGSMGWLKVESTASSLAINLVTFNATLAKLEAAAASFPATSFLFPDLGNRGFSPLVIGNANAAPGTLHFDLMGSDGIVEASAAREAPPRSILTAEISGLFPETVPDSGNYLKVTSDTPVLPFHLAGGSGATMLYSPQFAAGALWSTSLSIVNLDSVPGTVTIHFIADDHSRIEEMQASIAPHGKLSIGGAELSGGDESTLSQGYLEIGSDGIRLAGNVVFGHDGRASSFVEMPLVERLQRDVVFNHVSSDDFFFTGVALVNPNYEDAAAQIDLYDKDGTVAGTARIDVPAGRRVSQLLTQLFPQLLVEKRLSGYFRITSDLELASCAVFGSNSLSILSNIPPYIIR